MIKKASGPASAAQLLGQRVVKVDTSPAATSLCVICNKTIPEARIQALKSLGLTPSKWAHTGCSTVTKVKGMYLGEVGTSTLQICDKIYDDSVRSVFRKSDEAGTDEED